MEDKRGNPADCGDDWNQQDSNQSLYPCMDSQLVLVSAGLGRKHDLFYQVDVVPSARNRILDE